MNSYINISTSFWWHPKVKKLRRRLGSDGLVALIGLWCFAASHHYDGDLSSLSPSELESASGWPDPAGEFFAAVTDPSCLWLDPNGFLHNWRKHQGHLCSTRPGKRVGGATWQRLKQFVFDRDGFTCRYCGAVNVLLECDHVVPVSRGGNSDPSNLAASCVPCNRSKGDKLLEEWEVPCGDALV